MKLISFLGRLFLFWFSFFLLQHLLFFFAALTSYQGTASEFMVSFWVGLRMNIAGIFFLIALPVIFVLASLWGLKVKLTNSVIKWETLILLVVCSWICAVDIGIYKAWGTKINAKALAYLAYPKEWIPLLYAKETILLLPILVFECFFFNWWRKKWVGEFKLSEFKLPAKISITLLVLSIFIVGVRGGVQKVPLNRNQVFYSKHQLLNYSAMNSFWNVADLLVHPLEQAKNPYTYFDADTALNYMEEFNKATFDTTIQILNTKRPNIILIFLESWTADLVGCVGGEKDVTPRFTDLAKEGLLFTNFYSTGYRTEQGLLAMLSAFPAQPQGSVIYSWGKFDKLPNLFSDFNKNGYATSFFYGGRLQFDNVEAYLRSAGVHKIVGEDDFEIKRRVQWGAYDEETFALHLRELKKMKQPFFSMMGTVTTHEWFDSDVPKLFHKGDEVGDKFRNTMHYSDSCLYAYIKSAAQQEWFKNTLFVLVADHGCRFPLQRSNYEAARHHIPMLLLGGALKEEYKGKINDKYASHTDLANTLLAQLSIKSTHYPRSKNIFNPTSPAFAYYTFDNGFGLLTKEKSVIYDNNQKKDLLNPVEDSLSRRLIKYGKAYLQNTNTYTVGWGN